MLRPSRPKKKSPIEISDNKSISTFTFSTPFSSSGLFRTGKKENILSRLLLKKENHKPAKEITKLMTFTAGILSISFPPLSSEQYLQKALESLT